jgi:hypothetical protein
MPIEQLDLPKVYMAASQVRNADTQNEMQQMQIAQARQSMDKEGQLRALYSKVASGDKAAARGVMAIDPKAGIELSKHMRQQDENMNEDVAQAANWVISQPEDQRGQAYQTAIGHLKRDYPEMQFSDTYDPKVTSLLATRGIKVTDLMRQSLDKDKHNETKRHNLATEGINRSKGENSGGPKAADSNALRAQVGELFGGTFDPQTGRIMGLNKDQSARALKITSRASRIFLDGGLSHAEAVAKAAEEAGIALPGAANPATGAAPKPAGQPAKAATAYTQSDLEFTAKKQGISIDEVKKRLGAK